MDVSNFRFVPHHNPRCVLTYIPFSAENGCFVSLPERQNSEPLNGRVWHKLVSGVHESWRQPVLEILRYYTERTPGSMIDDRGLSIVWRYANTTEDQDSGSRRASIRSATDDASSEDLHSEAPIYKDGVGNEAYHWARRQAAEVQNHIMVSFLPPLTWYDCISYLKCSTGFTWRTLRHPAVPRRHLIPNPP